MVRLIPNPKFNIGDNVNFYWNGNRTGKIIKRELIYYCDYYVYKVRLILNYHYWYLIIGENQLKKG
jgi:hypothetical protein